MKSIVSYPDRGVWGRFDYPGNCSGYLIRDLIKFFTAKFVVDPTEGSGTTRDVCRELGKEYLGFDLKDGFNLLKDDLTIKIQIATGKSDLPDFIFFHPPYHDIIQYSGNVWGKKPHPDDLSQCSDYYKDYIWKLSRAFTNCYQALSPGGFLAVLLGDIRKNGRYHSPQSFMITLAPGQLLSIIVKEQHNVRSNSKVYTGEPFIPIAHEYCLIFKKSLDLMFTRSAIDH